MFTMTTMPHNKRMQSDKVTDTHEVERRYERLESGLAPDLRTT